jgi:hypothetical protein
MYDRSYQVALVVTGLTVYATTPHLKRCVLCISIHVVTILQKQAVVLASAKAFSARKSDVPCSSLLIMKDA